MRIPSIAGTWYPNHPGTLEKMIESWRSKEEAFQHPSVLLVPHAGYMFSGSLAAAAYSRVPAEEYTRIIILGPSHYAYLPFSVSVELPDEVETPFGTVNFSREIYNDLIHLPRAIHLDAAHGFEHCIDIQLPFIRKFFPRCDVGACVVGNWFPKSEEQKKFVQSFAEELKKLMTQETLIIISTDFTHYGERFRYVPFTENIEENLRILDMKIYHAFSSKNMEEFQSVIEDTEATVCGASAMLLTMAALSENAVFDRLAYKLSSEVNGDTSNCVSYTTAIIRDNPIPEKEDSDPGVKKSSFGSFSVSGTNYYTDKFKKDAAKIDGKKGAFEKTADEEKPQEINEEEVIPAQQEISAATAKIMLQIVKRCIQDTAKGTDPRTLKWKIPQVNYAELEQKRGAFVTINKFGSLRGCIGEILPTRPLIQVIIDQASNATRNDPRFPPIGVSELDSLTFEISVLTPPEDIPSYQDIVLGKHGVIIRARGRMAVFLPQVATEQNWDLETMLTQLSLKAGLPPDAWKNGAEFQVFTAQIIK